LIGLEQKAIAIRFDAAQAVVDKNLLLTETNQRIKEILNTKSPV
jgi:hypothetical protein